MKHIKTPVRLSTGFLAGDIVDADGATLCEMNEPYPFPVASEIICALNAHDALVEACKEFVEWSRVEHADYADYRRVIDLARAAIAKAELPLDKAPHV